MNQKTLVALLLFAALLATVYFMQKRPEKGQRTGEKVRPLPAIKQDAIKQVSITSKGVTVELARTGTEWSLVKPVAYPADRYATDSMAEKLEKLEFGDLVTENKARLAEYEVDEKSGIRVVARDGAKTLLDFTLGKTIDDFTMLRPAGKDQVYQAVGALRFIFDREVKNWRRRTIIEVKQEEIRKLEVVVGDAKTVVARADEKSPWKVEKVEGGAAIDQLDEATVSNLLSTFYTLSAFDFADGIAPEKSGLDKPTAAITAQLKSGSSVTLLVGGRKEDDTWVQRKGDPQVFVIKKYSVENLVKRPVDFRDKTVLSLKAKEKDSVKLTRKGNDWLSGSGKPLPDQAKLKGLCDALATLKAEGFASATAEELGMDAPEWTLEIQMKDRTKHVLSIGSKEKESFYGLARKGVADLFIVRKHVVDRLVVDPKNYK